MTKRTLMSTLKELTQIRQYNNVISINLYQDLFVMERKREVPTEIYSRVVGYFRPVDQWNKGKQKEFSERTVIDSKTLKPIIKEKNNPEGLKG